MDHNHKTWLWRKKSSEKTIASADKLDVYIKENEAETQTLLTDKAELETDLKSLNDKLSSALAECNAKDYLLKKLVTMAQEAIAGQEKAEAEGVSLKQELDQALQLRVTGEERLIHLDATLKECTEQLCFVREEQGQRIHGAVMKASMEFEKSKMILEEKLSETSKRLAKLAVENTHLNKALLAKEKLIEDLNKQRSQAETAFNTLMTRLDSMKKENATLKYEVRVLERELEIRNEEREFNRQTADASHKQHLDSVKKIAKLESECQRLRGLVRKRLPGPAALAKMKNEVEMLGRESTEMRKKRLNSSPFGSFVDSAAENSPDTARKKINDLTEQLCAMEDENRTLKEVLNEKTNELQFSRTLYARSASKISEVESQLEELLKGHKIMKPARTSVMSYELSLAAVSDIGSDYKASCAESGASALISELEHLRSAKQRELPSCKTVGASDISLMDDFVEMEKLAIVSVDKPSGNCHLSPKGANSIVGPLETEYGGNSLEVIGIVDNSDHQSDFGVLNQKIKSGDILVGKFPLWLQNIVELILEQIHVSRRNAYKILEDVRVALAYMGHPNTNELVDTRESSNHLDISNYPYVSSAKDANISLSEKINQHFHSDLSKSICKVAELIEGINLPSPSYCISENLSNKDGSILSYKNTEPPSGYTVRLFQWKTSELIGVVHQFIHACYDVLNNKADFNKFTKELSTALEWILNHCFLLQDVSSMRDAINKHFEWDEIRSENGVDFGIFSQFAEADRLHLPKGLSAGLPTLTVSNCRNKFSVKEELPSSVREESRKIGNEFIDVEAAKKVRQESLQSPADKSDSLLNQHQESEKIISNLQNELETLKKSRELIEDQVKNQKSINEVELENKNSCCEELETTCLELQLQLESMTKDAIPTTELKLDGKQIRTDWEISAASEKLAECQETILNLGKQLKALASPKEAALFDKVISTPTDNISTASTVTASATATTTTPSPSRTLQKNKITNQRSSLLDRMIAEDKDLNSLRAKGSVEVEPLKKILVLNVAKNHDEDGIRNSLAILPSKKVGGGGLWKKLFWRKKKFRSKQMSLPFAT